jgi:hypothetical protein
MEPSRSLGDGKVPTYAMEQSPSSEANRFSASQEILHIYVTQRFITAFTSALHLPFPEPDRFNPCLQIPLPEYPS